MKRLVLVLALAGLTASNSAACGTKTLAIIKSLKPSEPAPSFGCGQSFNEMLHLAQQSDWVGALAAYEDHLKGLGRQDAGTPDAEAVLAFLRGKGVKN